MSAHYWVLHSIVMTPTQEVTVDHVFQSHTVSSPSYFNLLLFVSFLKEPVDVFIWRFEVGVVDQFASDRAASYF